MPPPVLPPTPKPSTDLTAKPAPVLSGVELAFSLPPPALGSIAASNSKAAPGPGFNPSVSPSSSPPLNGYRPLSPTSPTAAAGAKSPTDDHASKKRRRPSTSEKPKSQPPAQKRKTEEITLPPPPSRARKIIQMRPRQSPSSGANSTGGALAQTPPLEPKRARKTSKTDKPGDDGKSTTAAGRKTARKTAHSLIERRRRFKMNEEFGVLKGMIPACKGVEMHKLAILQASIEYLKYLEQCVSDLKASSNYGSSPHHEGVHDLVPPPPSHRFGEGDFDDDEEEDDEEEEEAEEKQIEPITPHILPPAPKSPYLCPPQASTSGSPVIGPQNPQQHDLVDTEATHALLLLADGRRNSTDESNSGSSSNSSSRGMRVEDLLSP